MLPEISESVQALCRWLHIVPREHIACASHGVSKTKTKYHLLVCSLKSALCCVQLASWISASIVSCVACSARLLLCKSRFSVVVMVGGFVGGMCLALTMHIAMSTVKSTKQMALARCAIHSETAKVRLCWRAGDVVFEGRGSPFSIPLIKYRGLAYPRSYLH